MTKAPVLSRLELNRATLARQMLLAREPAVGVVAAVERLAGMQAQEPKHPFIGLWTRLEGFEPGALLAALLDRSLVRATLMRSTLHLFSAADYVAMRMAMQPPRSVALRVLGARSQGMDLDLVLPRARGLLHGGAALTFDEIRAALSELFPGVNDRALGYAVRTLLPLVMVPGGDARWGFERVARFTLAEEWLAAPPEGDARPEALARRYLAAFGPASAKDFQTWSGLGGGRAVLDGMRSELEVFTDEGGRRELFDLPGAPRPGAAADAPPRLLPEFDNLVLAWDDRSRLIADEHRPLVTTKNLRVRATFLVEGAVAGTWTLAVKRRVATLTLEPFARVPRGAAAALRAEAERLARFAEPDAQDHAVVIGDP